MLKCLCLQDMEVRTVPTADIDVGVAVTACVKPLVPVPKIMMETAIFTANVDLLVMVVMNRGIAGTSVLGTGGL